MKDRLKRAAVPDVIRDPLDVAPIDQQPRSEWLVLAGDGTIFQLNADTAEHSSRGRTAILERAEDHHARPGFPPIRPHLHASPNGRFAAVVNDYGRYGEVIDLISDRVTMTIDGGDYHPETVPLSFAFARYRERTVVIHRTQWNRLDVSDPRTGELLTPRASPSDPKAEHYLDYFHGALYVQPDGGYVLDDGWIWHPVGVPTLWSLPRWLGENAWESEDGPTKHDVCPRVYYWDHGMCWLGSTRVAIGGIGDDDAEIRDGMRIFDVTSLAPSRSEQWGGLYAREVASWPGPAGRFFSDGARLFAADDAGLSCWDPATGDRLEVVEGFRPTRQHRGTHELVELSHRQLTRFAIDGAGSR